MAADTYGGNRRGNAREISYGVYGCLIDECALCLIFGDIECGERVGRSDALEKSFLETVAERYEEENGGDTDRHAEDGEECPHGAGAEHAERKFEYVGKMHRGRVLNGKFQILK